MVSNPWVQLRPQISKSSPPTSPLLCTSIEPRNFAGHLPIKPLKGCFLRVKACSAAPSENPSSNSKGKNPLSVVLDVPQTLWKRTLQPLSDFGFGRRSVWEGGVGLFMVSGVALFALTMVWLRGHYFKSQFRKYQAVFEFSQACGIRLGTPVRIRGVTVGNVVRVDSTLKSIDAVVEVDDDKIIIPRNSVIEVNQSGLLMETLIDVTPQEPLPRPAAGPLSPECHKEGLIVCDKERIKGEQGVNLDALVGILTRLGQELEEIGVSRCYKLAEQVASVVQEAQPLLAKIEAMAEDIQPLLSEVRSSALLKDIEVLTMILAEATEDLRKVQASILTPENTDLIRQSVSTLVFTLKNIEGITGDISMFTGDEATRRNLKLLIKSLSRLL